MSYNTLDELFKKYPWKSKSKFVPLAKRYGFTAKDANDFLDKNIVHDVKVPKAQYIPIVSKHLHGYQMDTFINEKHKGGLNYLMSDMMKKIRGRLMVISEKINLRSCKLMNAYKYSYDY